MSNPTNDRMTFRVYLNGGAVIEFEADDMNKKTGSVSGTLLEVEWKNVSGNAPRYINVDQIAAITREIEVPADGHL